MDEQKKTPVANVEKQQRRKKVVKLKLTAEALKKIRLENLKKANQARKASQEEKRKLKESMKKAKPLEEPTSAAAATE
jgi:hypothetical protein